MAINSFVYFNVLNAVMFVAAIIAIWAPEDDNTAVFALLIFDVSLATVIAVLEGLVVWIRKGRPLGMWAAAKFLCIAVLASIHLAFTVEKIRPGIMAVSIINIVFSFIFAVLGNYVIWLTESEPRPTVLSVVTDCVDTPV